MIARTLLLPLSILLPVAGFAADMVTWMVPEQSALVAAERENAPLRIADEQVKFLTSHLAKFDHRMIEGSFARNFHEMAHSDGVCVSAAAHNAERDKVALFSARPVNYPGYRLIFKRGTAQLFEAVDPDGTADLEKLYNQPELRGGYTAGRALPELLEKFVERPERNLRFEKSLSTGRLFNLLSGGRLDFIFALAYETSYLPLTGDAGVSYVSVPIRGVPARLPVFIACSKGPVGASVIASIDELLKSDEQWRGFVAPLQRWLDPADYAAVVAQR